MRVTLTDDRDSALLEFDDLAEAEGFFADLRRQSGFFLTLDQELKHLRRVAVTATAAPRFQFDFEAEVVQLFPGPAGWGTAFGLCDWGPKQEAELDRKLGADSPEPPADTSPIFRIRKMNPTERFRLATKASRTERQILLRDNSPQVLLGLLAHPRIEVKEVLEIVKSTHASAGIMERVAKNRKWMANSELQLAIVKSPKTPPPLALKLLETLRTPDLGMLAKSSAARESLRKAALRAYLKRTGRKG